LFHFIFPVSYHKIYSNFVTTNLTLRIFLRDCLVKNAFYSIEEFLSAGHNDVDT
jgi:hypothetical protein